MEVHVAQADITNLPVDAVVCPHNKRGEMSDPIAVRIRKYGGDDIQEVVTSKAPLAIGAALVTEAGDLPAKWIIHVANRDEPTDRLEVENIRRSARAVLLAADASQIGVVAFPAMPTTEVSNEESARAIVEEIRSHKGSFPETIYLVDEDAAHVEAFETALENAQQQA